MKFMRHLLLGVLNDAAGDVRAKVLTLYAILIVNLIFKSMPNAVTAVSTADYALG